jgi:large subunit ribosomal protein L22
MARSEKNKAEARKAKRAEAQAARATIKGLRMSARKVRVLADAIRGQSVGDALTSLNFQRRAASGPLLKLLDSAVANAEQKGLDLDTLVVSEIQVHKGSIMRRFMPRAHGRATRIRKQTSHVEVTLTEG